MKSGWIHAAGGGCSGSQGRLWCLAIFRSPSLAGQQQLKPDKHMHKHTSVCMNACTQAHSNFTLTWNSVVLRMWRPSGLQREETSPIEPSSILQCQSGCSRDHTWRERQSQEDSDSGAANRHHWWYLYHILHLLRLDFKQQKRIRNHERLALDTSSKVSL